MKWWIWVIIIPLIIIVFVLIVTKGGTINILNATLE